MKKTYNLSVDDVVTALEYTYKAYTTFSTHFSLNHPEYTLSLWYNYYDAIRNLCHNNYFNSDIIILLKKFSDVIPPYEPVFFCIKALSIAVCHAYTNHQSNLDILINPGTGEILANLQNDSNFKVLDRLCSMLIPK